MQLKQEYKARASSAGILLTEPKTIKDREAGKLAKTVETHVHNWIKEQIYDQRKSIYSKYLEKGTVVEEESLIRMADFYDLGFVLKTNDKQFEDEWFTGTPDLILPDTVVDIKNSWDIFTFPLFIDGIEDVNKLSKLYIAQLQVYMYLTGKRKAKLIYCLSNTPENLILKDIRYKTFELEQTERKDLTHKDYEELAKEVRANHTYDDTPNLYRFKSYDIAYDPEMIETLKVAVAGVREYIINLKIEA